MAIIELYHSRQRRLRGEVPDVYIYDEMPTTIRTQIVQIMTDTLGDHRDYYNHHEVAEAYKVITKILKKEFAVFKLTDKHERNEVAELSNFILGLEDCEHVLSVVEVVCIAIDRIASCYSWRSNACSASEEAIIEINHRFRDHALGYEFNRETKRIVRIDSQLVHAEVVKPALALLQGEQYAGAKEEFLKAHEHYRKGNAKEALTEALKALESVLKTICTKRGWQFAPTDTAAKLIKVCFEKELVDSFWQAHFNGLRTTLEAGIPTARNKLGAHGQGSVPTSVPDHLVSYVLHMTASAIVFLVRAEEELP